MSEAIVPPPSEFVQFWNEILVPKFVKYKHVLVGGLGKHSAAIFPKLEVNAGERVMDAGAGFGDTAIMLAERVGPGGHVDAIDCCDAFLDYGRTDAAAAGVGNVSFIEADIQFTPFRPEYDLVFSRFGTMFFENPVAAMRNMRTALKPGGRFTMIVWRDRDDNPLARCGASRDPETSAPARRGCAHLRPGAVLNGGSGVGERADDGGRLR